MNRQIYVDLRSPDLQTFYFSSIGQLGVIKKAVVYTQIASIENGYNLGFGTVKIDENGEEYLDGEDRTNNGDTNKVLSTVAKTIEIYTSVYRERKVYFAGYIPELTRLYQRAIRTDYSLIKELYNIYGDLDYSHNNYNLEPFKTEKEYFGFILERK